MINKNTFLYWLIPFLCFSIYTSCIIRSEAQQGIDNKIRQQLAIAVVQQQGQPIFPSSYLYINKNDSTNAQQLFHKQELLLVQFISSWSALHCNYCKDKLIHLNKNYQQWQSLGLGVKLLLIDTDINSTSWKNVLILQDDLAITEPIYQQLDAANDWATFYNIQDTPTSIIINNSGELIHHSDTSTLTSIQFISKYFDKL